MIALLISLTLIGLIAIADMVASVKASRRNLIHLR